MDMVLRMRLPRRLSQQIPETLQRSITSPVRRRVNCSPTEKSPASSSCEQDVVHQARRLGDVVAQSMSLHCQDGEGSGKDPQLKDSGGPASEAAPRKSLSQGLNSVMDEIHGACTPADMWWVEKKISTHISCERAKAYRAFVEQHHSMSNILTGRDGSGNGSSEMAEVEEEFHKSISDLISTIITEGAKVPGNTVWYWCLISSG